MANQFLLLQDVDDLGRSGDVVSAKPGYARNFLLPKKLAVIADATTLRMRARLQEMRAKKLLKIKQMLKLSLLEFKEKISKLL